ncbi:hypothetical protein [Streptomyces yangpuensis]|uniref:hypothetical protein n=1 Tax=Streptomyces yangpuensis TaxID=1648182 RepID=UPI003684FBAB
MQDIHLRILLRTNGPNLSRIPWEFLVDPTRDDCLALRVPVVRYLRLMDPVPPLPLTLPLRVLGISAQPHDLPALEGKREGEQISRALLQECSRRGAVQAVPARPARESGAGGVGPLETERGQSAP